MKAANLSAYVDNLATLTVCGDKHELSPLGVDKHVYISSLGRTNSTGMEYFYDSSLRPT